MGTFLPVIILWVLVSTHLTHLHCSPMRGQRVYGREFLRIPVPDSNAGSGKDTITNRQQQRTRQDNSKIDPDNGDRSWSYIISQLANKTSSEEEQKDSSLFRSSSFSRSLRRPWYKDSPLPVSSHTSQEAVRRRLPVNNQTLNNNKTFPKENHSPGTELLKQNLQNNPESSIGTFLLQNNYHQINLTLNSSSFKSSHIVSLIKSEADFPTRHGSIPFEKHSEIISSAETSSQSTIPTRLSSQKQTTYPFSKDIPSHKLHIDSTTSIIPTQNHQRSYTTIRKLFGDITTFIPLTTETLIRDEPKSTTEFILYPISKYDDYYDTLDDETQLISTTDEIAVTDPYIGQESVTEVITEPSNSNYREKNESEYKIYSNEHIIIPASFTNSTTEKSIQLYNNTIKLIPRKHYSNTSPSSTTFQTSSTSPTVQISSNSTSSIINTVQTKRPTRRYKYTTPSLALRQRLLANRFGIRQVSSERRGRLIKSNPQNSKNPNQVITNIENSVSNNKRNISISQQNMSYGGPNNTNSSDTNTTNNLSIQMYQSYSYAASKDVIKPIELSTPKSQNNYSTNQKHISLPSLQIENPFMVNIPIETNIPYPSPLHLLTDSLIVEVNIGPIMKNQGYSRNTHDSLEMTEQSIKVNQEINGIQQLSLLDNNDTFIILPHITKTPITTLQGLDLFNLTQFNQFDTHSTQTIFDTTITNTELSTDELDIDIFIPVTINNELPNVTSSSAILSTIIPSTTQSSIQMKTKEGTKASWEAQSRSLSTSAVRTEVRTTEHEVHVKIYEKLPTPAAQIYIMLESIERLKKQQGTSPLGSFPFGTNPAGTSAFGLVPQGRYPQGRNPLGLAALQQSPRPNESTIIPTTITTSTSSNPNIKVSSSQSDKTISEPNQSKFQLERKTKDGFIIGEYGVIDHDKGNVNNGVRYTAEANVDPKLIHDALQIFLSL